MMIKHNPVWKLFSTVRLALFLIALISATSILGTIIPQGEPFSFYVDGYGPRLAMILEILTLNNMYYSVWFKVLLSLLCLNIIVCSYTRLPIVLKVINQNNFDVNKMKNKSNKHSITLHSSQGISSVVAKIGSVLNKKNYAFQSKEIDTSHLFFYQTGAWSRFGAYIVHLSILVIFLGAIIGAFFGFKSFVMIPEGKSIKTVYSQDADGKAISLPFELFCENFNVDYYDSGTPKEYKSDLIVLDGTKEILRKSIKVNAPLSYKGITFYQASYQQIKGQYTIDIVKQFKNPSQGKTPMHGKVFTQTSRKEVWEEGAASFKIVASSTDGHGHGPYKVEFDDVDEKSIDFIVNDNSPFSLDRSSAQYTFTINQRYATGLQVAKDPGVWLVYLGSGLMLFGLFVAFFMSHRRIWVLVESKKETTLVHIYGNTNKNQPLLNKNKETIASMLIADESIEFRRI